jgi:NAD(P)-dependent dehydrogenase (short-subunit alcohol dehydrogenase family)
VSKLAGKIALITGGSSGIGLATAKRFVDEGAYVFITGRREAELSGAIKGIGNQVRALKAPMLQIRGPCSRKRTRDRLRGGVNAICR